MQAMETFKRVLRSEHPDTLTSIANLASTLKSQGRNKEAISLMKACIQLQKQILGPHHPNTESSLNTLNKRQMENRDRTLMPLYLVENQARADAEQVELRNI